MITLLDLNLFGLVVTSATLIYLGGIALWLFIPWMGRFHRPDPKGTPPETTEERRLIASTPEFALEVDLRAAAHDGADYAGIYVGSTVQYHRRATQQP